MSWDRVACRSTVYCLGICCGEVNVSKIEDEGRGEGEKDGKRITCMHLLSLILLQSLVQW